MEYLEETHPEPPLLPSAPADRAYVRAIAQMVACEMHPLNNLRVLKYLENVLEEDEENYEADGVGAHGSLVCGDMMKIWIHVDENEVIRDIKWKTYGCAAAIGTTSLLSTMVKGKTIEEARKITAEEVVEAAEGLPDQKVHCSLLGDRALRNAINDYFERKGLTDRIVVPGVLVCECKKVTEEDIEHTVAHGVTTFEAKGEPFDPAQHEAVQQMHADAPQGEVFEQLQRGFMLHERLLRPAMVVVSLGPAAKEGSEAE